MGEKYIQRISPKFDENYKSKGTWGQQTPSRIITKKFTIRQNQIPENP